MTKLYNLFVRPTRGNCATFVATAELAHLLAIANPTGRYIVADVEAELDHQFMAHGFAQLDRPEFLIVRSYQPTPILDLTILDPLQAIGKRYWYNSVAFRCNSYTAVAGYWMVPEVNICDGRWVKPAALAKWNQVI